MATKRKHNEEGMDGRIVRLKLINFLTYDDCEFEPGQHLNVILGPNGTGKSSIVCAICLGLGGKPTLLGRAKDICDYVQHRKDQATIEIELYKASRPNLIVKRIINRGSQKTLWYLNGKESSQNHVVETVGKMNVQMNNLCQFLPQDRVAEFAKMSPQQLLEATEKAVGPPDMYEKHLKLINLRYKFNDVEHSKAEKELAKERVESRNKTLERDVQRHIEREKHQEVIEMLEKKRPWVEYETARNQFMEVKEDKTSLEKKVAEERKLTAPMEKEKKKIQDVIIKIDKENKDLVDEGSKYARSLKSINDKLEKQQDKMEEVKNELSSLKHDEDKKQNKINKLKKDIEALQKDYESAPDPEVLKPRCEELSQLNRDLQNALNHIHITVQQYQAEYNQVKIDINSIQSRIRVLESTDNQKLESLRRCDKSSFDAVNWLRLNQDKFSGVVYEPIMTQINMKDMKNALYLESLIAFNDMKAFVCQNREDQKLFSNITRDQLRINVAVVCPPRDAKQTYHPKVPMDQLRQYGFGCFVSDMFTAPLTVTQYLCEKYQLHNIPVGDVERNSQTVIENVQDVKKFCSTESVYSVSSSLYHSNKSTNVYALKKQANWLNSAVDMEEKKRLDANLNELQSQYNEFHTKHNNETQLHKQKTKELEAVRAEKKELQTQSGKRRAFASQITTKQRRLNEEEGDRPDIEAEEKKALKEINQINKIRVDLASQSKDIIQKCVDIAKSKVRLSLKQVNERMQHEIIEAKCRASSDNLKRLEEAYAMVNQRCNELKARARNLLKRAQETTKDANGESNGDLIPETLKEAFDTLPSTLDDIDAAIHEEQARLQCQFETNPGVIKDYKRNKKEIIDLTQQIEDQTKELETMTKEIDDLLESWLVPLEALIGRINEQYCDFFRRMGCAGQVTLDKNEDNDYKKFGVQIQVKFRADEKLKVLTSYFQSGGERSVSTMLYLISLQELTKCPFRLVDEINQGMDPNNERRVFELVVETVCRPNTSQYFLITPKLLPDLKYTDRMTILTVLNGHWMLPHTKFSVGNFIKRKKDLNKSSRAIAASG